MDFKKDADVKNSKATIGIIANVDKQEVLNILPDFLKWLSARNVNFIISEVVADKVMHKYENCREQSKIPDESDVILSFGGDGTFLRTARLVAPREVPIVGINLGTFGYLAEVILSDLYLKMDQLLSGDYSIQERMMIEISLESIERTISPAMGLNDLVVDKGGHPRTILLETYVNGEFLNIFKADGLIVSTPTGSTGYSLSAGGPILEPNTKLMIVNPICPHMLANRPLVISPDSVVRISVENDLYDTSVAVDGQNYLILKSGEYIYVKQASCVTKVVVFSDYSFFALLRNKLQWKMQS